MGGTDRDREWIRLRQAYGATGHEWTRMWSHEDDPTADERRFTQISIGLLQFCLMEDFSWNGGFVYSTVLAQSESYICVNL
jgi:hypothetical protein